MFAGIEGTRPLLVEIQALVGPSPLGTPRRAVVGWDGNRLAMLLAVLETRCGLAIGGRDVYLNVAGGLRIGEPAADLAVAAAWCRRCSIGRRRPAAVVFGEVGLAGEVRAVGQTEARLKEAAKLGFEQVILPAGGRQERAQAAGRRAAHPGDQAAWRAARAARRACAASRVARFDARAVADSRMPDLPLTAFDLAALAVIAASVLVGGSARRDPEALTIATWLGAGVVAFYGFPYARELGRRTIETEWLADAAALCVVFVVPLIGLKVAAAVLADHIPGGALGAIDRFAGAGVRRGAGRVVVSSPIWA